MLPEVPLDQVVSTLNGYDIGLSVLYPSSFGIKHALPNKFFGIIWARLGLVVGPSLERAVIVTRHGIGTASSGFDVDATARTLSAERRAVTLSDVVSKVVGGLALMLPCAPEALDAASLVSSQAS